MRRRKIIWYGILALVPIVLITVFTCNYIIDKTAKGKIFTDTKTIPYNRVGLLLGTSKKLGNGYPNLYYTYRIDAAARLLGK